MEDDIMEVINSSKYLISCLKLTFLISYLYILDGLTFYFSNYFIQQNL